MCAVDNITPGRLVTATAGRDKGSVFVATEVGQGIVFIADGKRRKLENPKRKNIKHISPAGDTVICLDDMTNKKLRKLLRQHLSNVDAAQHRPSADGESSDTTGKTTENLRKGD